MNLQKCVFCRGNVFFYTNSADYYATRPGHDLRYGLSREKMAKMGWVPPLGFEDSLRKCIEWTATNSHWLSLKKWADEPSSADAVTMKSRL